LHGPNGFVRKFNGSKQSSDVKIKFTQLDQIESVKIELEWDNKRVLSVTDNA